jgi:hypothetical protein
LPPLSLELYQFESKSAQAAHFALAAPVPKPGHGLLFGKGHLGPRDETAEPDEALNGLRKLALPLFVGAELIGR